MVTQTQLSLHLSIFPPKEGYPQETPSQYERAVWPGRSLASSQTQIHSEIRSPNPDLIPVSKPSRTLDYHPRLRFKHQGKVRTNKDAQIE